MEQTIIEFEPIIPTPKLVVGGIYIVKDENLNDIYDGMFGLCMGSDKFYFLCDGMNHIENEVELACAHRMKFLNGYTLGINKNKKEWQIRNSGIVKSDPKHIIAKGRYYDPFEESLKPFFKVFTK